MLRLYSKNGDKHGKIPSCVRLRWCVDNRLLVPIITFWLIARQTATKITISSRPCTVSLPSSTTTTAATTTTTTTTTKATTTTVLRDCPMDNIPLHPMCFLYCSATRIPLACSRDVTLYPINLLNGVVQTIKIRKELRICRISPQNQNYWVHHQWAYSTSLALLLPILFILQLARPAGSTDHLDNKWHRQIRYLQW